MATTATAAPSRIICLSNDGFRGEWRAVPHPDGNGWCAQFRNIPTEPDVSEAGWEHLQRPSWHSCAEEAWLQCYRQIFTEGWEIKKVGDDVPAIIEYQGNAVLMEFETLVFAQHEPELWSAVRPGEDTGERWRIRRREWGGTPRLDDQANLVKVPHAVHYICTYKPDRSSGEISLAYEGKEARGGRHPQTLETALGRCLSHARETAGIIVA